MSACDFCGKDMSHLNKTNKERHYQKCEREKEKKKNCAVPAITNYFSKSIATSNLRGLSVDLSSESTHEDSSESEIENEIFCSSDSNSS